ncbi:MAG: (Fe-S)-binding protein [Actinomycetales bacterium]|nr:(Fe-S)-binding protein [Actinomycetales bacterium]
MIRAGQPAVGRTRGWRRRVAAEGSEVLGQRTLLQWWLPGVAHVMAFYGFIVLGLTIIEAWGAVVDPDFAIPVIGRWPAVGFAEDLFAVLVLVAVAIFAGIRLVQRPHRRGRASRFYGSHTGTAWLVLAMITGVIVTLVLYRAAQVNTGTFPFPSGAFLSEWAATLIAPLGTTANEWLETIGILANIAVILGFLLIVLYSKHMHIAVSPFNVYFSRRPDSLGPLLPIYSNGAPVDFDDPGEDDIFGRGRSEDFTWKAQLDFLTCTECGRCQSQCPAWATEKPLNPKLLIMALRDHVAAKAPLVLAGGPAAESGAADAATTGAGRVQRARAEAQRPLVGDASVDGVIDPAVLWSCTTCGACVHQCPVDIEHIDHIVDMRRHQVLVESQFPAELTSVFRNTENAGNPWGMGASARTSWIDEVDFPVRVLGRDGLVDLPGDVEYLFWVGCAGAFDDRARRTTKAVAELLHLAGVGFAVLGDGETCTGDPARRAGNEFLFQQQAQANVATLDAAGLQQGSGKAIVVTCPHCLNTLGREYPQVGGEYEVVHHTVLLDRLVREGRLTPVVPLDGGTVAGGTVTYHDPCYLGRHNKVYNPPRDLLAALPGVKVREMPQSRAQSFCCGAGGARMWMEETIGTRVNLTRTDQALATGATTIAVACPFCNVMLSDGVAARVHSGDAPAEARVDDLATLLLAAVRSG